MTTSKLDKIQGAILASFVSEHYINEVLTYNIPEIKHGVKQNLKRTQNSLKKIEKQYFDRIDNDEEGEILNHQLTSNMMDFLTETLKGSFADFAQIQQVLMAFKLDKDEMQKLTYKILKKHGAK